MESPLVLCGLRTYMRASGEGLFMVHLVIHLSLTLTNNEV